MASGFAYALAGGVKGFGEGLVAQAQAEREASRERIRMMFQREERVAGQEFTLERDDAGREFTTSEREASQGFQAAENARTRAAAASRETKGDTDKGELITMEDGTLGVRRGDKVTPVTGPDDKPVKGAAKDTSHASRASVFKTMLESIKSSDSGFDMSPEEQAAEAQRLTDEFFRTAPGPSSSPERPAPSAPAAPENTWKAPAAAPEKAIALDEARAAIAGIKQANIPKEDKDRRLAEIKRRMAEIYGEEILREMGQ